MKPRLRAGALCLHENRLLMVRLEDPATGRCYDFPPGGGIEPGESEEDAARREVREETGYLARLLPDSRSVLDYPFRWGGQWFDCRTVFFLAALEDPNPAPLGEVSFLKAVLWVPREQVASTLSFHPELRDHVVARLRTVPEI